MAPDYSDEGIAEFYKVLDIEAVTDKIISGEHKIWGYFKDNTLVGVIRTRAPSHISLFFVDKKYQRQGIATGLLNTVEDYYKKQKQGEITVYSSPYAVEIYKRLGFKVTGAEAEHNGIRSTPMKKRIKR